MSQADRDLLYDALAAYRITRLISADTITQPLRVRVIRFAYEHRDGSVGAVFENAPDDEWDERPGNDPDAPKLATLVTCRYCVGVWVAAGVTLARWWFPRQWEPVARGLACAGAAVLIAGLEKGD